MDSSYMQRCIALARMGAGWVAPNPMVGAVLVHENRIIGEGWHRQYGGPHAEVYCLESVVPEDVSLIPFSTLYVSLEPCAHYGKTPPCADLIIRHKIPRVVIGSRDPFPDVNGKGIGKLEAAGIEVTVGVEQEACLELNKRFFTFYQKHRPYIILKWATTANGMMAAETDERLLITAEETNRLVHRWRSEEASILVGTHTARVDDPALNARLWPGHEPVRLVIDMDLTLPSSLQLFNHQQPTIVFNTIQEAVQDNLIYCKVSRHTNLLPQVMNALVQRQIQSVLVEGGAITLQHFLDEGLWDEIRVLQSTALSVEKGLPAPTVTRFGRKETITLPQDSITYYFPS